MNDDNMQPLTEHLSELRRRIIWVLLFFVATLIVSFIFSQDIFYWIKAGAFKDFKIHAFGPGDSLKIYMQISFILSFIFTSPVILYHIWQFVRPGLRPREQRAALSYIPMAVVLFLAGLSFGYFVIFPYLIQFTEGLNEQFGLGEMYGVYQSFSFLFNIIFPLGLIFELPVVVLFLTRIRLISPGILMKARRVAYLVIVIIAAVITPPQIISNILVALPMVLLYEISIALSAWVYRRMEQEEAMQ
ncbi:twin-arginine translocase subunit TatC [Paenactinomyces guangxiensis]|uniref:Sec-independent protein translocase protein TatC n=1 Tax=Paenactinomyces guangxiensis TaxID=1490290 RepID=A0A7W1WT43_9BACL|nr:twin-arginine translocase subunit TatC [Paenactinomyces guangxiensis]MBA4495580.1 twin-arginine translocase subunit TatC [Paenactinomyces guangxiensis]MBH8592838.1 twin-arginine translocase subunit TatC [Paenactinomyces guangxiensis]